MIPTPRLLVLASALPILAAALTGQEDFRAQAFAASTKGDLARAADLFYRLFKAGTEDKKALSTGARCLEKSNRLNDALDLLVRGTERFPQEAAFRVGMARVFNLRAAKQHRETGRMDGNIVFSYEDSIREAETALKTWPENRDARLILANSLYSLGKWEAARVQSLELIRRFPRHPGGHIVMGDLAFEHYKLLRKKASDKDAETSKQAMLKIVGAREAARDHYQKAIELDATRIAAHRRLGDLLAWNAEVKPAVAKYRDCLLLDPATAVNHTWIGESLSPKERVEFYESLGKEYLGKPDADRKKAAIFAWYSAAAQVANQEYRKGEELYQLALTMNPEYTTGFYYAMYSAYFYRKDVDAALAFASAYAAQKPIQFADVVRGLPTADQKSLTELVRYLAKLAMDRSLAAASRDLNHVLAAIVDTADAWNNYAFMARESQQFDRSIEAYRHALEIQPGSGQLMNDLGVVLHYHKGQPADLAAAEALYRKAIAAAQAVLADGKATAATRSIATQTLADATSNLTKLVESRKAKRP